MATCLHYLYHNATLHGSLLLGQDYSENGLLLGMAVLDLETGDELPMPHLQEGFTKRYYRKLIALAMQSNRGIGLLPWLMRLLRHTILAESLTTGSTAEDDTTPSSSRQNTRSKNDTLLYWFVILIYVFVVGIWI